jgi:hypothetical protein
MGRRSSGWVSVIGEDQNVSRVGLKMNQGQRLEQGWSMSWPFIFPQNPELGILEKSKDVETREDPIWTPNPVATKVPRDNDWGLVLPPLLATQLVEPELGEGGDRSGDIEERNGETNIRKGRMHLSEILGSLEGDAWRETFMALGMQTYWKDPVESPAKLRGKQKIKGMQERKMEPERIKACQELLEEELDQQIVIKMRYQEVGYINPMLVVPKPPKWDKKLQ